MIHTPKRQSQADMSFIMNPYFHTTKHNTKHHLTHSPHLFNILLYNHNSPLISTLLHHLILPHHLHHKLPTLYHLSYLFQTPLLTHQRIFKHPISHLNTLIHHQHPIQLHHHQFTNLQPHHHQVLNLHPHHHLLPEPQPELNMFPTLSKTTNTNYHLH